MSSLRRRVHDVIFQHDSPLERGFVRVFRILKLAQYVQEASVLAQALRASRHEITVFISTVLAAVTAVGAPMYMIETPEAGFTSIPQGVYWAIVTMTTGGHGDISPVSPLGKLLASYCKYCGTNLGAGCHDSVPSLPSVGAPCSYGGTRMPERGSSGSPPRIAPHGPP